MVVAADVSGISGPRTSVTTNQRGASHKKEDIYTVRVQWMPYFSVRMESCVLGTGCSVVCALLHLLATVTPEHNHRKADSSNSIVNVKVCKIMAMNLNVLVNTDQKPPIFRRDRYA